MVLIDFGSSAFHPNYYERRGNDDRDDLPVHTTFCGSSFYSSPEMFQRSYTQKTDCWSAGVVIYVLAAGYPATTVQQAVFDALLVNNRDKRKDARHRLWSEPPLRVPKEYTSNVGFVDLLNGCLRYQQKLRPNARELIATNGFLSCWRTQSFQDEEEALYAL